jgi:DNA polymerase (family X)
MQAEDVARMLDEMGTLLELKGENPFRCRAYHTGADAVRGIGGDLDELVASGKLTDVPGIGEAIRDKVVQVVTTGRMSALEELREEMPSGLVALLRVPGLGPKKIKALHQSLKIESLLDLRKAAESGAIAGQKGFGAKTQEKILEGLNFVESAGDRVVQRTAIRLIAPIVEEIRGMPEVHRV